MALPSLAELAMAPRTSGRFRVSTPTRPSKAKSAAVSAPASVPLAAFCVLAAVSIRRCTTLAKASILGTVSTSARPSWPMLLLSSNWALDPLLRLAATVAPIRL